MAAAERMKTHKLTAVEALEDYRVRLVWDNKKVTDVDLREPVFSLKSLEPLRNIDFFKTVRLDEWGWSIVWSDAIDMGVDSLWRRAQEQAGFYIPKEQFHDWRKRNRLSLDKAAEALGLSRRTIAYYEKGELPVPKVVGLACKGWEVQQIRNMHQ